MERNYVRKKRTGGYMKKKVFYLAIMTVITVELILAGVQLSILNTAKRYQNHISLGDKYFEALDYENAELYYLAAIKIDKKNVTPYIQLSHIYVKTERYEEASDILEEAKEAIPESDTESMKLLETVIIGLKKKETEGESELSEASEEKHYVDSTWLLQSYKGNIYAMTHEAKEMTEDSGFIQFEGYYEGDFAVYKDSIYYTCYMDDDFVMCRCDLDGKNTEIIVDDVGWGFGSLGFYFYEDSLFYTANVGDAEDYDEFEFQNRCFNLNTKECEDIEYSILGGNEFIWLIQEEGSNRYDIKYCKPYFEEIRELPEHDDSYFVFVYEKDIYYSRNGQIFCYSTETQEETPFNRNEDVSDRTYFYLENNGLYYYKKDDKALYRYDLINGTEQRYDIDIMEENYRCDVEYEVDGNVYFSCYRSTDFEEEQAYYEQYGKSMFNMELYEMDLETGTYRYVGGWFSP